MQRLDCIAVAGSHLGIGLLKSPSVQKRRKNRQKSLHHHIALARDRLCPTVVLLATKSTSCSAALSFAQVGQRSVLLLQIKCVMACHRHQQVLVILAASRLQPRSRSLADRAPVRVRAAARVLHRWEQDDPERRELVKCGLPSKRGLAAHENFDDLLPMLREVRVDYAAPKREEHLHSG